MTFNGKSRLILMIGMLVAWGVAESASAQQLQYQPYGSWRGRAVARDGLLHSQRYVWRNGISPTAGTVLTTAIPFIPAMIDAAIPGGSRDASDRDSQSRGSSRESWAGWSEYAAEQKRATDLLERLDRLANGENSQSNAGAPDVDPKFEPKLTKDQLEQRFSKDPSNPWKK